MIAASSLSGLTYLRALVLTLVGLLVCGAIVGAGTVYAFEAILNPGLVLPTGRDWLGWGAFVVPSVVVCGLGIRAFRRAYHQGESYDELTTYLAYIAPVLLAAGLGAGGVFGYSILADRKERRERQSERDCSAVAELANLSDLRLDRCIEAVRSCRNELRDSPCNQTFNSPKEARECRDFRRDQIESLREYGLDLSSPRELSIGELGNEDPDEQSRRLCVLRRLLDSSGHSAN